MTPKSFIYPLVALVCGIAVAQSAPTLQTRPAPEVKTALPSEETVTSFLHEMFGYDPTISYRVVQIRPSEIAGLAEVNALLSNSQGSNQIRLLVSSDGKKAVSGDILPFGAKPFEDARAKLDLGVNGPSKGPTKAAVTIVEFSDMQCPHCQKFAPQVEQLVAQEPEARFVFQNFPLPSHDWAAKAAGYVECTGKASNEAVWKFIQKTFEEQNNITEANADEKLKALATAAGVNAEEVSACADKPETKARIEASRALGRSVGVNGTPSLFINGRSVPSGAPVEVMKKMVEFEAIEKGGKQEKTSQ